MRARRRPLPWWMVFLVVTAAGLLIFLPDTSRRVESFGAIVFEPIEGAVSSLADQIVNTRETLGQVNELARQNDQYREDVERLQAEITRLQELEVENRDLRNLLGLKERVGPGELRPVSVVARDPSPFVQSLTIDRGTDDGVQDGMSVITWRGLVGRVTRATTTTSKVLLLIDVTSSVSGRVQNSESRVIGTVRGRSEGGLLMQHIPQEEKIETGDTIISSDLGGVVPEGLVIGKIVQVRRKDAEVFQEALIEPAADMRRIERLYVLIRPVVQRQP